MTAFDPAVIHEYADGLYLEATRAPLLYGVACAVVAVTAGFGLGQGMESFGAGMTLALVLGAMAGWVGYVAGRSVATRMRLAAQTALLQLSIQEHISALHGEARPGSADG